jgi:hypothetical protein
MNMYEGLEVQLHAFLNSALDEVVSFMAWPLYPQRKSPWYPMDRSLGDIFIIPM